MKYERQTKPRYPHMFGDKAIFLGRINGIDCWCWKCEWKSGQAGRPILIPFVQRSKKDSDYTTGIGWVHSKPDMHYAVHRMMCMRLITWNGYCLIMRDKSYEHVTFYPNGDAPE